MAVDDSGIVYQPQYDDKGQDIGLNTMRQSSSVPNSAPIVSGNVDLNAMRANPVTVQYPSGHVVSFPSEAHANEHAASVWDQLKEGWNKVKNFQGLEGSDGADRQGDTFGQSIIDHVGKWHKAVSDTLEEAGAELGRKPAELLSGVKNFSAYMPSPYGQKPSIESIEETAKREHPVLSGVGEGAGRFAGGMLSPTNVAIMAAMPAAKAIPLLSRGLSIAFAADMGSGAVTSAKNVIANWSKMTPQQRTSALTSGSLQTVLAGLATIHAAGEGKLIVPAELKGESGEATVPGTGTVGTAAGAAADTRYFQEAKEENPDASFSDWLRIAQDKKLNAAKPPVRQLTEADKTAAAEAPDEAVTSLTGKKLGVKPIEVGGKPPVIDKAGHPDYNLKGQRLGIPPAPEDIGTKVRAEQPPMPRGERRVIPRTPEEEQTANAFRQAIKELGPDATTDAVDARMAELGVPARQTLAGRMGAGIPEIIKRLAQDESGQATIPFTGEQQNLPLEGEVMPDEEPDAPLWYSHAIDTIDNKVQNNMTPEQVRGVLVNAGVKPDEFTGTGLDQYLDSQKGKISKPELQQFMKENQLQLREIQYGGHQDAAQAQLHDQHSKLSRERQDIYERMRTDSYDGTSPVSGMEFLRGDVEDQQKWLEAMTPEARSNALSLLQADKTLSDIGQRASGLKLTLSLEETEHAGGREMFDVIDPKTGNVVYTGDRVGANEFMGEKLEELKPLKAKYSNYIHGKHWADQGGLKADDYTEKLLLLPETNKAELAARKATIAFDDYLAKMREKYQGTWYSQLTPEEKSQYDTLENAQQTAVAAARNRSYKPPHFGGQGGPSVNNLVAHARYGSLPEMSDKKTMVLHEVQSDWNTDIRAKGYRGEAEELDQQIRNLRNKSYDASANYRQETDRMTGGFQTLDKPSAALQAAQAVVSGYKNRLQNGEKFTGDELSDFRAAQARVRDMQKSGQSSFTPEDQKTLDRLVERKKELEASREEGEAPVESGPLVGNWHELALKRMLREAVDKGYERMVWPTGEQQADLYGLYHHIKDLTYDPYEDDLVITQHNGTVKRQSVAPTVKSLSDWMVPDLAKKLYDKIKDFKSENVTKEEDSEGLDDDQIYEMMAESYSVETDDNEPEPYWEIYHDGELIGDTHYSEREAKKALDKWWEEEHPHHDIDTGEYLEPEEGEERSHPDDEEKGDIEVPEIREGQHESEPSYSVYRDGEHIEAFDTERAAERARERMISDDVDNYDGPRKGDIEKLEKEHWPRLSNLDLHHGGEFHKLLYDTMVPSFLKQYTKKWGAKVGMMDVPNAGRPKVAYSGPEFTIDQIRQANPDAHGQEAAQGELLERMKEKHMTVKQAAEDIANERDSDGDLTDHDVLENFLNYLHRNAAEGNETQEMFKSVPQSAPMHFIEIPPLMKRALTKGKGQKISKRDDQNLMNAPQEQNA